MFSQRREPVVSIDWLADHINNPQLIIMDVSQDSKPVSQALKGKCIPNSIKVNLDDFCDLSSEFPNSMVNEENFEKLAQELGVNEESCVVFYDNQGIYWSPRFWWMFKTMGHEHVFILNGGLPAWAENEYPTVDEYNRPLKAGNFKADYQEQYFKMFKQVDENLQTENELIIDARSKGRFEGTEPEPRKDIKSGCIPNSVNIPFTEVLENGKFKRRPVLEQMFAHFDHEQPLIFSCGSGITACIVLVASILADFPMGAVYDGSWTEWAMKTNQLNQ